MTDYFRQLQNQFPTIRSLSSCGGVKGFFGQEALRFHSIAGSLVSNFSLDKGASVDERYITHILVRSLLEDYFWLIYLFDVPGQAEVRYEQLTNSFKRDYSKLMNENQLPHKDQLEPAEPSWASLQRAPDVNSMLAQVTNDYGDRLSYLYFIYRITSFDTHGKNLGTVLQTVFGKTSNFPVLDLKEVIQLVANQYLVILDGLRKRDEI
jgi:hypothetical protein